MARAASTWPTIWRSQRLPPRPLLLLLLLLTLAAIVGSAYGLGLIGQQSNAVTYQSAPATRGSVVSAITATGPITSPSSLPLTFKSSGKLTEVNVKVGDKVTAGQVLARMDTTEL